MDGSSSIPAKTNFMDQFSYEAFRPVQTYSRATSFAQETHNRLQGRNYSSTVPLLRNGKFSNFQKFMSHEMAVSKAPVQYLKSSKNSMKRKAFDIAIGGPVAGIIDTISSTVKVAIGVIATTVQFIGGAVKAAISKGKDIEMLSDSKDSLKGVFYNIKNVVKNALRAIPVIGVFVSYGAKFIDTAITTKIEDVAYAIKTRLQSMRKESHLNEREFVFMNPTFVGAKEEL